LAKENGLEQIALMEVKPKVNEAIKEVVENNIFNYYPATCNLELLQALAEYI